MEFNTINWLAVLVAALSAFILGGVWYSPVLFSNAWLKENNLTTDKINQSNKVRTFSIAFLLTLVMATILALFLNDAGTTVAWGTAAGFLAEIWVFAGLALTAMFELKTWTYVLINGGYHLVALTLMGAIIGL